MKSCRTLTHPLELFLTLYDTDTIRSYWMAYSDYRDVFVAHGVVAFGKLLRLASEWSVSLCSYYCSYLLSLVSAVPSMPLEPSNPNHTAWNPSNVVTLIVQFGQSISDIGYRQRLLFHTGFSRFARTSATTDRHLIRPSSLTILTNNVLRQATGTIALTS